MNSLVLKVVIIITLFYNSISYADYPIVGSANLDTVNYNCNILLDKNKVCLKGGWYLDYIGMDYIYENNYNLNPNFTVGIMDSAIGNHESIDLCLPGEIGCTVRNISTVIKDTNTPIPDTGEYTIHGNMVTSIFSGSKDDFYEMRSMVHANTIFISLYNELELNDTDPTQRDINKPPLYQLINNNIAKPKIINISYGYNIGNLSWGEYYEQTSVFRNLIKSNSDILFVVSAGNDHEDAVNHNSGLHYEYIGDYSTATLEEKNDINNYRLNKLQNLIIVAANDFNGNLFQYSNFGESVDITAPSGVFASGCNDATGSYYYKVNLDSRSYYGYDNDIYKNLAQYYVDLFNSKKDYLIDMYVSTVNSLPFIGDLPQNIDYNCNNINLVAEGNSASAPIVAGAAAILLANDESLTPAQLKYYLTESSLLAKANNRYIDSNLNTEILAHQIPILNIEKSMKQYEADNTFVEDFENFMNPQVTGDSKSIRFSDNSNTLIRLLYGYVHNSIKYTGHSDIYYSGKNTNLFNSRSIMFYLLNDASIVFPKKIRSLSFSSLVYGSQNQNEFDIFDQNGNKLGRFTNIPSVMKNHVVNIPVDSEVTGVFFKNVVGANNLLIDNMSYSY